MRPLTPFERQVVDEAATERILYGDNGRLRFHFARLLLMSQKHHGPIKAQS